MAGGGLGSSEELISSSSSTSSSSSVSMSIAVGRGTVGSVAEAISNSSISRDVESGAEGMEEKTGRSDGPSSKAVPCYPKPEHMHLYSNHRNRTTVPRYTCSHIPRCRHSIIPRANPSRQQRNPTPHLPLASKPAMPQRPRRQEDIGTWPNPKTSSSCTKPNALPRTSERASEPLSTARPHGGCVDPAKPAYTKSQGALRGANIGKSRTSDGAL